MRDAFKTSIGRQRRSPVAPVRVAITAMVVAAGLSGPMSPASATPPTVDKPGAECSLRALKATSHPAGAAKTHEAPTTRVLAADDEAEGELAAGVPPLAPSAQTVSRGPNWVAAEQSPGGALRVDRAVPHVAA